MLLIKIANNIILEPDSSGVYSFNGKYSTQEDLKKDREKLFKGRVRTVEYPDNDHDLKPKRSLLKKSLIYGLPVLGLAGAAGLLYNGYKDNQELRNRMLRRDD